MKYQYFYQTKANENREGWIKAPNRAEAYAALRKRGIRPFRVVGDDPVKWQPWAYTALVAALLVALAAALFSGGPADGCRAAPRRQLAGDPGVISTGLSTCWDGVFDTALDRYLAAYAQPGWIAIPPETSSAEMARFPAELAKPLVFNKSDTVETRLLKDIVAGLRDEMRDYLAAGGDVAGFIDFLESRQDEERAMRSRALAELARAPAAERAKLKVKLNAELRGRGIYPLD